MRPSISNWYAYYLLIYFEIYYTRYHASMESFNHYPSYSQIVILSSIALIFKMIEQNWKIEQKSTKSITLLITTLGTARNKTVELNRNERNTKYDCWKKAVSLVRETNRKELDETKKTGWRINWPKSRA